MYSPPKGAAVQTMRARAARRGRRSHPDLPRTMRTPDTSPLVGITASLDDRDLRVRRAYTLAVERAGGTPLLLVPPTAALDDAALAAGAQRFVALCDAIVFTGGDDPATERYGEPTHPAAKRVHPDRQRFEEALLGALDADEKARAKPVLGICLGMQMMALHAGGSLHQHLPESCATAAEHMDDRRHAIEPAPEAGGTRPAAAILGPGEVTSWHHQAVRAPGRLRVVARAPDGVIEAVDDPARPFYLGVQWHPERTPDPRLGDGLFRGLVHAATRCD